MPAIEIFCRNDLLHQLDKSMSTSVVSALNTSLHSHWINSRYEAAIDHVGWKRAIDHVGWKKAIDHVGWKKAINHVGWKQQLLYSLKSKN